MTTLWSLALVAHAWAVGEVHGPGPLRIPAIRAASDAARKLGMQLGAVGKQSETQAVQRESSEVVQKSSLDSAKSYLAGHKKELTPFEKHLLSVTQLLDSKKYSAVTSEAAAGTRLTGNKLGLFKQLLEELSRNPGIQHLKDEGLRLQQHPALLTARLQALSSSGEARGGPRYVRRVEELLSKSAAPELFENLSPLLVGLLLPPAMATAAISSACANAADHHLAVLQLSVDTAKEAISAILKEAGGAILADSISLQFGIALGVATALAVAPVAAYTAAAIGVAVFAYTTYQTLKTFNRDLRDVQAPPCESPPQSPQPAPSKGGPITLEPLALTPAMQYVPYGEQLMARVEVEPKSWRLEEGVTGPIPAPLLDDGEGHYSQSPSPLFYVTDEGRLWMITGTAGEYAFNAEAREPNGQVVKQPYTISVSPAACSNYPCAISDKFEPMVPLADSVPEPGELTFTFVWSGDPCLHCIGFWPLTIETSETAEEADFIICFESGQEPYGVPQRCSVTYSFAAFGSSHRTSEISIYFDEVGPPPHAAPVPIGSWTLML